MTHPEWLRSEQIWTMHRNLFAENGDALARIYAGTGALNTSFTRSGKRTLAGVLSDAGKSVGRVIQSNFADAGKQAAIDELLASIFLYTCRSHWLMEIWSQGNLSNQQRVRLHDPVHEKLDEQLKARETEYSSFSSQSNPLTLSPFHVRSDLHFPTGGNIWVGTYNLNGKPPGSESLLPWLFPDPSKLDFFTSQTRPRLLNVSFQSPSPILWQ